MKWEKEAVEGNGNVELETQHATLPAGMSSGVSVFR